MSSDTSSIIGVTENPPDVNGLPSNFLSIMDITKDRSNTRGRKTGGKTIYTCTVCGDKRYDHKAMLPITSEKTIPSHPDPPGLSRAPSAQSRHIFAL